MGKELKGTYKNEDIKIDRLFRTDDSTYHEYQLSETDITIVSDDTHDLALLVLPKQRIIDLVGKEFFCPVVDTADALKAYFARGFADFNDQNDDRPYDLQYIEDKKDDKGLFLLRSNQQLDTFRQAALDNLEGLSGSGAWVNAKGNIYLVGIIHGYEEGNIFNATKVLAYNRLIPADRFPLILPVRPELNDDILSAFGTMDNKREEVNSRTRETVGDIHISRDLQAPYRILAENAMVVIHGKPGVGKSAMAKELVARLKIDGFGSVLTLAPENLFTETFNAALTSAGYTATIEQLLHSPLTGGRLVIWIESFEKLLESAHKAAFNDLLQLMKKHPRLALIVTTRDYLLQKLKINFHFELPQGDLFHGLETFSDDELAVVREKEPSIEVLFRNPAIQEFLRTPYYLDKALRILPHLLQVDQLDEAGFKRIMWEQVVEAGDEERGKAFYDLALKRAKELSLYTNSTATRPILQSLIGDHILQVERGELANSYAPTHDILEDWALIRYIKLKRQEAGSPGEFLKELEQSPAVRRAFRLWLEELARQEPIQYAGFIREVLDDSQISSDWQDDVIIASLRSPNAKPLIETLHNRLLADEGILLRKVFQMLKTSCKNLDLKKKNLHGFTPVGSGWDEIIQFVRAYHAQVLALGNFEFGYLAVIEDWISQLPLFDPSVLPPAAADAAWLLEEFLYRYQEKLGTYRRGKNDDSLLKKYAGILFKLTAAAQPLVQRLLEAALKPDEDQGRWTARDLLESVRDYATQGLTADQLTKYFPDIVIQIANEDWPAQPKTYSPGSLSARIIHEPDGNDFGLDDHLKDELESPSAYQTFVYWMLRYHPAKALDFVLPFLNAAFAHNQRQLVLNKSENLLNIKIQFVGTVKSYYGTHNYWSVFRGAYVQNRLIISILMGLERALLEMAKSGKQAQCQETLDRLIIESNNVSVLAVVASVLQAYPNLLDEISVRLISEPKLLEWDMSRHSSDYMPGDTYQDDPVSKEERILANRMPHRLRHGLGLIGFVAHYIFYYGKLNEEIFEILDGYWAALDSRDVWWKKFLFDMDARKYNFEPVDLPGYENYRQLVPGYDEKVQEMRKVNPDEVPASNSFWPKEAFENKEGVVKTVEIWRQVRSGFAAAGNEILSMTSPGTLSAVGLRDMLSELNEEEIKWCQDTLLAHAEKSLKKRDMLDFSTNVLDQNYPMEGFSFLFKTAMEPEMELKAKTLLFRMLTASLEERPEMYLQVGVAFHLSEYRSDLTLNCWHGILEHIRHKRSDLQKEAQAREEFEFGIYEPEPPDDQDSWRNEVLEQVVAGTIKAPELIDATLDHGVQWLLKDALQITPRNTADTGQQEFVKQLLDQHFAVSAQPTYHQRDEFFQNRITMRIFYAGYLLNQPADRALILFNELLGRSDLTAAKFERDSVNGYIFDILKQMIRTIDGTTIESFWKLWDRLRVWTIGTKSLLYFDLLFLDLDWTENSENWWVLDGKKAMYKEFIFNYGFNRINVTVKFLAGIGFRQFMPESIQWVAQMLLSDKVLDLKIGEKFVQKAFFDQGEVIKADEQLKASYLSIIEKLISWGSPLAYLLREELITSK
ncbi:hypothetical protein [Mucilaginibacter sp.]|uniref:nSTAND3 domain-containing NTPase n=1 Tax=Mucilaginibacter sp. TaxID=1882438 RepID=UPI003D099B34